MRNKTNVACVILNYNDAVRTKKLVERIIEYNNLNLVIVVDNNSSDDSVAILKSIQNDKYKLIKSHSNGGYGAGNNIGLDYADSVGMEYVIIANPDVIFSEECIEQMLITIKKYPNCAILGAKEICMGVSGWKYTSGLNDVLSASLLFNKLLKARYYSEKYFNDGKIKKVDLVPGCFLMVDLKKMLLIGKYDEEFFLYEEEKVLYKKSSDYGFDSLIDTSVSFEHNHIDDDNIKIIELLKGKKRLLCSKYLYLKKYRRFNSVCLFLSRVFFLYAYIEMAIYGGVLKMKKGR